MAMAKRWMATGVVAALLATSMPAMARPGYGWGGGWNGPGYGHGWGGGYRHRDRDRFDFGDFLLGAVIIGVLGGLIGYLVIQKTWRPRVRPLRAARPVVPASGADARRSDGLD